MSEDRDWKEDNPNKVGMKRISVYWHPHQVKDENGNFILTSRGQTSANRRTERMKNEFDAESAAIELENGAGNDGWLAIVYIHLKQDLDQRKVEKGMRRVFGSAYDYISWLPSVGEPEAPDYVPEAE